MKVKATKKGLWPGNTERLPGAVFDYDGPTKKKVDGKTVDYFPSWMEKVSHPKPEDDPGLADAVAAKKAAEDKTGE